MAMLLANGKDVKDPSSLTWGLQDVSNSAAGRTEDTYMHKNRVGQKRMLSCGWRNIKPAEAAKILQQFNDEYISVTYPDTMSNTNQTRTFYVGDRTAPFKWWSRRGKYYSELSFDLIER